MRSKGERCRNVAKIMGWVVTGRERQASLSPEQKELKSENGKAVNPVEKYKKRDLNKCLILVPGVVLKCLSQELI